MPGPPLPTATTMRAVLFAGFDSVEDVAPSTTIVPSVPGVDLIFSCTVGLIRP